MTTPTVPPDWYPDPQNPDGGTYRWWDGHQWTNNTHTTVSAPPPISVSPFAETSSVNQSAPESLARDGSDMSPTPLPSPVAPNSPVPPKKRKWLWYGLAAVAVAVVVGVVIAAVSVTGSKQTDRAGAVATTTTTTVDPAEQSRQQAAAESAERELEQQRAESLDKATYQTTDSRGWQLIAKSPDSHVGEKYVIYGRVVQADVALGSSEIRVNTDGAQVDYYDMDINTIAKAGLASFADIVEDDLVTMWVEVKGSETYDTTIGGSVTAPVVEVNIIEVTGNTK
ncbi:MULTISPECIES: DUF2510 domain-containing protein [unclassified Gordonia (in: high G+C Gram-positive bacteria)]